MHADFDDPARALLDARLDARLKGYPSDAPPLRRSQLAAQGWNLLADDLPLPVAVLDRAALRHNLDWLQALVDREGIALAPHGKTTLSPELFRAQVEAGAWGITVASVHQLELVIASGIHRALIANQVLQAGELRRLARHLAAHPALRAPFLVDQPGQLDAIEALAATTPLARPFELLLEVGQDGGRTGCRSLAQALALARRIHASPAARLVGLSGYEGLWASGDAQADAALVQHMSTALHALLQALEAEGLFETDTVLLSAGGSALFDRVAPGLRGPAPLPGAHPVLGLLRSGCYVSHDSGHYRRLVNLAEQRLGCAPGSGLQAALTVWCLVQSRPEPGLAILNAGKRDLSFDMGLPLPRWHAPAGTREAQAAPAGWIVRALNDQHAHLVIDPAADPADVPPLPALGDRIGLGISHPCTTFDKWRWMPVVDEHWTVVDGITTGF